MPKVDESRLQPAVGTPHHGGRPYHFSHLSQDDRIRKVFGLTEKSPIPAVHRETLAAYYDHLRQNVSLPFDALYCQNGGEMRQLVHHVQITELVDPRDGRAFNTHGLFCRARNHKEVVEAPLAEFGLREDNPNCQLIDDYAYWFVNWR
jgi:hypothetical protein